MKSKILGGLVVLFLAYALIGVAMILVNQSMLSNYTKIVVPLVMLAVAILVATDNFRRFASDKASVRAMALISFVLGLICVVIFSLATWEVISFYDQTPSTSIYSYTFYSYTPNAIYKISMVLLYITLFAFLGSNNLSLKENDQKIIHIMKPATVAFLACSVAVSIISVIVDDTSSISGFPQMTAISIICWISWLGLSLAAFFMSKVAAWDNSSVLSMEPVKAPIAPSVPAPLDETEPIQPKPVHHDEPAKPPVPKRPDMSSIYPEVNDPTKEDPRQNQPTKEE